MSDFVSKEKQLQAAKQTDYGRSPLFRAMQIRDVAKARKLVITLFLASDNMVIYLFQADQDRFRVESRCGQRKRTFDR